MVAVPIEDPADPRLEPYRAVRERDLAGRDGLYVAEGRVVLEKAVAADPAAVVSVLVAAHRLEGLGEVLAGLPAATPVYAAGQAAMDAVVGFPIHRGILALVKRPRRDAAALVAGLPAKALVVGLVGIANHDNMGGVFRNAAAFGADAVLLDDTCCDPLYRKAIRVSVGAALTVPFARAGDAAAMGDLLARAGFDLVALSPRGEAELEDHAPGLRTAILFGAEGPGLPDAVMARARTVRIAMAGGFDSLNVATTSGIVLHNLSAKRRRL
ncbi:RNA methyltransferase [Phenylobacterium sp.]|uniref:TrmH family RNA methyltransferase n=1 Tax=Phenylobacterium sp. TaxID=1871053 RepID=UPI0025CC6FA6|nr:RNA methyltransferase [Phenylobacterium sp.]MBX3485722.1 RNA methyltransferase [Phenylobacterium sp.]MCW5761082.1 RNA methyltransferase [Phenylobacterium sp.]